MFDLVVNGEPNKRIASTLGISMRTVEIHRKRVMEKMGAGSIASLVKMAAWTGVTSAAHAFLEPFPTN